MIASSGSPLAVDLFPPADWYGDHAPEDFAVTDRYPGPRPIGSFQVADGRVNGLDPVHGAGWVRRDTDERIELAGRHLVLAYGSNLDPRKLTAKLPGTVYALRAAVVGYAAVWCNARRSSDGAVVATLHPQPGRVEVHGVLAVTDEQLARMDAWEGHPAFYRRQPFDGTTLLEDGSAPTRLLVYVGTPEKRPVLLVNGRPLTCSESSQDDVDHLVDR